MQLRHALILGAVGALAAAVVTVPLAGAGNGGADILDQGDVLVAAERATGPARAADPHPLTGEGQNMQIVANIPVDFGSDLELSGDYAYVGSYNEGMVVIDIKDPTHPQRVGLFACKGGQNDIQLSPDARYAVMAIDTANNACHRGQEGTVVLDIQDPTKPHEVAWIPVKDPAGSFVGSHNNTLDWPRLYVDQYQTRYHQFEIYDLSTPSAPTKLSTLDAGASQNSSHDLIVDHRPDGRSLVYSASIAFTDVIDVTDPTKPKLLQRISDPAITTSHQAEPNFNRSLLLVTDEWQGGGGQAGCGKSPAIGDSIPAPSQDTGSPGNIGALHIYRLNPDGTMKDNGADKAGTFNIPLQPNADDEKGCTIHVFWQAPDQNRMVAAWYGRGVRVIDYSDPANAKELGYYIPTDADTWAAKPHKGYIFTGDINRGFDVLKYTGPGWPATFGDAAVQRAAIQSQAPKPEAMPTTTTTTNPATKTARRTGGYRWIRRVRVPGRGGAKVRLVATFLNRRGGVVSRLRFTGRRGRTVVLRARIGGLIGRYRYTIRVGDRGRVISRGAFRVKATRGAQVRLAASRTLVCTKG